MSKKSESVFRRKPMAAAVVCALCICLVGATAMASSGKLQGYFKDIIGWNGAVVGSSYEQATEEMEITVVEAAKQLSVEVKLLTPDVSPYSVIEQMAVGTYKIVDENGEVLIEADGSEFADITDGKVQIHIPLEKVGGGNYKLVISEMIGSSKADQPLSMSGYWECEFMTK